MYEPYLIHVVPKKVVGGGGGVHAAVSDKSATVCATRPSAIQPFSW